MAFDIRNALARRWRALEESLRSRWIARLRWPDSLMAHASAANVGLAEPPLDAVADDLFGDDDEIGDEAKPAAPRSTVGS